MLDNGQRRTGRSCSMLCFKDCNQQNPNQTSRQQNQNKPSKISLKKVMEQQIGWSQPRIKKSISHKNLEQPRYQEHTNRSNQSHKQQFLFKKKAYLEKQISDVDKEMTRLTHTYEKNLWQLKRVKNQLNKLKLE